MKNEEYKVGDVVTLGSSRTYDVTEVDNLDQQVRVWGWDFNDGDQGQWVSMDYPRLKKVSQ